MNVHSLTRRSQDGIGCEDSVENEMASRRHMPFSTYWELPNTGDNVCVNLVADTTLAILSLLCDHATVVDYGVERMMIDEKEWINFRAFYRPLPIPLLQERDRWGLVLDALCVN